MKSPSYNPYIGYKRDVLCLMLINDTQDESFIRTTKLAFEAKINNTNNLKERALYHKKIDDLDHGVIDAINVFKTGQFIPLPWSSIRPGLITLLSPNYRRFDREFYDTFTKNADYSLGRNNASIFLLRNKDTIDTLKYLSFRNNPPTELEMTVNGFLRTPEYMEQYSLLVKEMNEIRNALETRRHTPEFLADVKRRTEKCTKNAKILNENSKYLLSVESRFIKHYSSCSPGVIELAISELYRNEGVTQSNI